MEFPQEHRLVLCFFEHFKLGNIWSAGLGGRELKLDPKLNQKTNFSYFIWNIACFIL